MCISVSKCIVCSIQPECGLRRLWIITHKQTISLGDTVLESSISLTNCQHLIHLQLFFLWHIFAFLTVKGQYVRAETQIKVNISAEAAES
jgi:hypothetical protein